MTLPQNVKDAVRSIDDSETVAATPHPDWNALVKIISVDDWQIISAHLLSQDAELAGYKAEMERLNVSWAARSHDVVIAESRLAAATAEIEQLQAGLAKHVNRVCELQDRLAAANERLEAAPIATGSQLARGIRPGDYAVPWDWPVTSKTKVRLIAIDAARGGCE